MERYIPRGLLISAIVVGLIAVTFAAPAYSDFCEVKLPVTVAASMDTPHWLNLIQPNLSAHRDTRAEAPMDWRNPFSFSDPIRHERRIEPPFVMKC